MIYKVVVETLIVQEYFVLADNDAAAKYKVRKLANESDIPGENGCQLRNAKDSEIVSCDLTEAGNLL